MGVQETGNTWPVMGPASEGHGAELVLRADSSEWCIEGLSRGCVGRRPVVFGREAVRPCHAALSARRRWGLTTGADLERDSPKYLPPVGAKTRLQVRSVGGLPAGSLEGQAEALGRVHEDVRPGHHAGVPRRVLVA
ncbi:hypothetical protein NDU88_002148 [Pleurodeles waltl]|uniref:Uncharacterized protein n=1 Tax=Pleurodeles waltl TaxID=8319 RepID=A0AAV7PEI0_PLEWA|nr:hypothetical protein NDU88_002148 [Pleurodeles waltl]